MENGIHATKNKTRIQDFSDSHLYIYAWNCQVFFRIVHQDSWKQSSVFWSSSRRKNLKHIFDTFRFLTVTCDFFTLWFTAYSFHLFYFYSLLKFYYYNTDHSFYNVHLFYHYYWLKYLLAFLNSFSLE